MIKSVTAEALAQVIRQVDGTHTMGAAALAEAILGALPNLASGALDATDYQPGRLDATAPGRIWLQINTEGDNSEREEAWPGHEHVTWQDEPIGGLEIEYVRADLAEITACMPPASVSLGMSDGDMLLWALISGFGVEKGRPSEHLTEAANAEFSWLVCRLAPPYCDRKGKRSWHGPTPAEAIKRAAKAVGMELPDTQCRGASINSDEATA